MKALFLDKTHPVLKEMLLSSGFICDDFFSDNTKEILQTISSYDGIIVRSKHHIDKYFIDNVPHLKWIARVGAGMETIDIEYAGSKGIICLNSPEGNRDALGEHALGMLLCLFNKINLADTEIRTGFWLRELNRGLELKGKTIGIIGFGNMGSAFAQRLQGFECKILAYDKYKSNYAPGYVEETSLEEIYEKSDIVSLHLPLTKETYYYASEDFFSAFKKPIYFINTARGEAVNTNALVENLKTEKVLGACLDVLEYEDMQKDSINISSLPEPFQYLIGSKNVILTPHVAGWSVESKKRLASVLAKKIIDLYRK